MIVKRREDYVLRIADDGSLTIPAGMMQALCKRMNKGDDRGFKQDLEDFGPGRIVVMGWAGSDSGTEITIQRDRRVEARK